MRGVALAFTAFLSAWHIAFVVSEAVLSVQHVASSSGIL